MPRKVVNKLSRQVIDLDFTETRRKSTREDRSKEDRAAISQITAGSRESSLARTLSQERSRVHTSSRCVSKEQVHGGSDGDAAGGDE